MHWKNRVLVMTKYTKIVTINTYISILLEFNCITKFDKCYPIVNLTPVVPSINCGCSDLGYKLSSLSRALMTLYVMRYNLP